VDDLVKAGFKQEDIGVISHETQGKKTKKKGGTKWEEGAVAGAATGAGVGALWALGMATIGLPALGPVIAGGLLASVLASAAGGAAVAGIVGALIGLGIPEEDAQYYEGEFKEGRTLVTVRANGRYAEALEIIRRHGGYDRSTAATNPDIAVPATAVETEEAAIETKREQVKPRKTRVKKGEVRVRKEVVTDTQTIDVPVEREEVVVERRPARRGSRKTAIGSSEEIRIPVSEDVVNVDKEVVADEEVKVGKRKVQGTKTVNTPVRREKVKVDEEGTARVTRRSRT